MQRAELIFGMIEKRQRTFHAIEGEIDPPAAEIVNLFEGLGVCVHAPPPRGRKSWPAFGMRAKTRLARSRRLPERLFQLRDEGSGALGFFVVALGFFD